MGLGNFATVLLLAVPLAAQPRLPALRVEATDGGSIFYVRNLASQPLTAYLVELVDYPGSEFAFWQDGFLNSQPIPSGVEARVPVTSMLVGAVPDHVKVQAAVYADGTSAGIREKVAQLIDRRRAALRTAREVITRLEKAQSAGTPAAAVSEALRQWATSMRRDAANVAPHLLVMETSAHLRSEPLEHVLAEVRAIESVLAASKPALF